MKFSICTTLFCCFSPETWRMIQSLSIPTMKLPWQPGKHIRYAMLTHKSIYMLDSFREVESFSQECFDWNVMLTFRPWMFHCWSLLWNWQRMQMTVKRRMNLDTQKVGNISLCITDLFYYLISQYFLWIFMLKYDFYPEICMSYFITTEKYEKKFNILISKCYWLFLVKRKIGYQ